MSRSWPSLFRARRMGGRYGPLLATLILAILLGLPLREAGRGDLFSLVVVAVLYAGARASTTSRSRRRWYLALLTPTVAIDSWIFAMGGGDRLAAVGSTLHIGFMIFTGAAILEQLAREKEVSLDTILGGVCVFLLIGVVFGYVFSMVETLYPGSLLERGRMLRPSPNVNAQVERRPQSIYFSFVTLTTVGYGDIAPARSLARVLSILEAIAGQIFLTTFLAFLVGNYLSQRQADRSGGAE